MLTDKDYRSYFEKGISFETYLSNMTHEALNPNDTKYTKYVPANLAYTHRVLEHIVVSKELHVLFGRLKQNLNWLVISEHWCGDASETVPIMQAVAEASHGKILLRIVYRDQNQPLINAHLTNGGQAIPKLLQLDEHYNLLGSWGARPVQAQALVMNLKAASESLSNTIKSVHQWYEADKTRSTQEELHALLNLAV
ncbi:MAG: thioredoxin family protein [Cytophagales bacterium]|nr:MAG: thioredoxin family protein [Cytophagales bacterium]TAF60653.1 MAG: thioredoxin family protein [Cytophagales bacterium]